MLVDVGESIKRWFFVEDYLVVIIRGEGGRGLGVMKSESLEVRVRFDGCDQRGDVEDHVDDVGQEEKVVEDKV